MKQAATFFFALLLAALFFGDVLAQSNSTAEQLYQKWSQNNRTEHSVAHEAAKEYLKRFPSDKYAQQLKAWVTAYEKIINQEQAKVGQLAAVKIGYLDVQRTITESQAGKDARARFQTQVKKVETDLLKDKQELERLKSNLDKKAPSLNNDERGNLAAEYKRRYDDYQRKMADSQEELRQRNTEMVSVILRDIKPIVTELGKKERFTVIVEMSQPPVPLYDDQRIDIKNTNQGIDITKQVIEIYNKRATGNVTNVP